ncbi:MAG: hypothetical protein HYW78_02240 [Parcubacteria group bacterium]|nr:hypothetical protein [Parcubacteria group bacterium]
MQWNGKIFAHRCGMARGAENTLSAIQQAHADGANSFECDVRSTADNQPILFHDATTKRMNETLSVSESHAERGETPLIIGETKYKELRQKARLGVRQELIPHIYEVFQFCAQHPSLEVFFDLKEYSFELVKDIIEWGNCFDIPYSRYSLLGYTEKKDFFQQVRAQYKDVRISVMPSVPFHLRQQAEQCCAKSICTGWTTPLERLFFYTVAKCINIKKEVELAHSAGIKVYGGITNDQRDIQFFIQNNFDGIFTDDVLATKEIIKKINE